nr:hypothetical protein Iba_chr12aCG11700 [Ipomoea batatas]
MTLLSATKQRMLPAEQPIDRNTIQMNRGTDTPVPFPNRPIFAGSDGPASGVYRILQSTLAAARFAWAMASPPNIRVPFRWQGQLDLGYKRSRKVCAVEFPVMIGLRLGFSSISCFASGTRARTPADR